MKNIYIFVTAFNKSQQWQNTNFKKANQEKTQISRRRKIPPKNGNFTNDRSVNTVITKVFAEQPGLHCAC